MQKHSNEREAAKTAFSDQLYFEKELDLSLILKISYRPKPAPIVSIKTHRQKLALWPIELLV